MSRLLPPHVVSAETTSSALVRIVGLLLGLKRPGNTDSAPLNTCSLDARVSLAWEALWQSLFSGMTSFGRVLDLTTRRRCCSVSFQLCPRCCCHGLSCPAPARPSCCPGPSPWHMKVQCWLLSRRSCLVSCLVCRLHPPAPVLVYVGTFSPSCLVLCPSCLALCPWLLRRLTMFLPLCLILLCIYPPLCVGQCDQCLPGVT